jgi:hypothetical protein
MLRLFAYTLLLSLVTVSSPHAEVRTFTCGTHAVTLDPDLEGTNEKSDNSLDVADLVTFGTLDFVNGCYIGHHGQHTAKLCVVGELTLTIGRENKVGQKMKPEISKCRKS